MTDTTDTDHWRLGHEAARDLHDALLAVGIPESELTAVTARSDASGTVRVVVPPLSVGSTRLMLAALGPYLGPRFVGRRDAAPIRPAP